MERRQARKIQKLSSSRLISTKRHMLKHFLTSHKDDPTTEMVFRMKILGFSRSAYERQIKESVLIQSNRGHILLNSKSEFNRCSLTRLTVKLGESEINALAKANEREIREEEILETVIKEMKNNSKKRMKKEDESDLPDQQKRKRRKLTDQLPAQASQVRGLSEAEIDEDMKLPKPDIATQERELSGTESDEDMMLPKRDIASQGEGLSGV